MRLCRSIFTWSNKSSLTKLVDVLESSQGSEGAEQLLQICTAAKALAEGTRIHAHLSRTGGDRDRLLANLLVRMYGACGCVDEARRVFEFIDHPNQHSWNILVAAFAQNGHLQDAANSFHRMPQRDVFSWTTMIAAFAASDELGGARQTFDRMPWRTTVAWNSMISAFASTGDLQSAHGYFDSSPQRDIVSWSAVLNGYGQQLDLERARRIFDRMPQHSCVPSTSMLTAYSQTGQFDAAVAMFLSLPSRSTVACNAMIRALGSQQLVDQARDVFDQMPAHQRDPVTWSTMLAACLEAGHLVEARRLFFIDGAEAEWTVVHWNNLISAHADVPGVAFEIFQIMDLTGIKPTPVTFVNLVDGGSLDLQQLKTLDASVHQWDVILATAFIKAYAQLGSVESTLALCRRAFDRLPTEHHDVASRTAMVTALAAAGETDEATAVFESMPERDAVAWTSMVAASGNTAPKVFAAMLLDGTRPLKSTLASVLGSAGCSLETGRAVHSVAVESGMDCDVAVGSSLVGFYGRHCGGDKRLFESATAAFARIEAHNVVSWTSMMELCLRAESGARAMEVFGLMDLDGVSPDQVTFVAALGGGADPATDARSAALVEEIRLGLTEPSPLVAAAMISFYARSGDVAAATRVLDRCGCRAATSCWNAALQCCGAHVAASRERSGTFRAMALEGAEPDSETFMAMLSCCVHGGLIDEARRCVAAMASDHGLAPSPAHLVAVAGALSRSGRLDDAAELLETMPFEPGASAWTSLLAACESQGDATSGAPAAGRAAALDASASSPYVLLFNMVQRRKADSD